MAKKLKLLVVDDEDSLRLLVHDELVNSGYQVDTAESGETALEMIAKKKFDIVILDIRMPGIDGLEVLKHIREEGIKSKVILLTGVNELKIARDSLEAGADDFLMKPYDFRTLKACLERVVKE